MATTIRTTDTYEVETRRNLIPTPRPAALAGSGWVVGGGGGVDAGWVTCTVVTAGIPYIFTSYTAAFTVGEDAAGLITVRSDSASVTHLRVGFRSGAGVYLAPWTVVPTPVGVDVTAVVHLLAPVAQGLNLSVVPCDAAGAFVSQPVGAAFRVRDPLIEKAPAAGDFFYGDTPAAGNRRFAWAGTAGNSESIEYSTVPVHTVAPILVDGYEATREPGTVVHDVINKIYPDVTLRAAGARRGSLRMLFATEADAINAYAALAYLGVFTIADPDVPGIDMRFVVAEGDLLIGLDDESRKLWWVEVPFVEVAP